MKRPLMLLLACCALASAASDLKTENRKLLGEALASRDTSVRYEKTLAILKSDPSDLPALQLFANLLTELAPDARRKAALELLAAADAKPTDPRFTLVAARIAKENKIGQKSVATVAQKTLDTMATPAQLASDTQLPAYVALAELYSSFAAATGDYAPAAKIARKLAELRPMREDAASVALNFFCFASRLAPDSRRTLWLRRSERAEYAEEYNDLLGELAKSENRELQMVLLSHYVRIGEREKMLALAEKLQLFRSAPFVKAYLLAQVGAFADAVETGIAAVPSLPPARRLHTWNELAEWACSAHLPDKVAFCAANALAIAPDDQVAKVNRVLALYLQEKHAEMTAALKDVDPAVALYLEVLSLTAQKKHMEAIQRIETFEKAHPEEAALDSSRLLLLVPAEYGRLPDAVMSLKKKMQAEGRLEIPSNANDIGYVMSELEIALEEAASLLAFAVAEEPENCAPLDSMAWVNFKRGRLDEAQKYIERALVYMKPNDNGDSKFTILRHAGDIALARGKQKAALDFYEKALALRTSPLIDRVNLEAAAAKLRAELAK